MAHTTGLSIGSWPLVLIASECEPVRCILAREALRRGIRPLIITTPVAASNAGATPRARLVFFTDDPTGRIAAEAHYLKAHVINADLASALGLHKEVQSLAELAIWRTIQALFDSLLDGTLNDLAPPFSATESGFPPSSPAASDHAVIDEPAAIDDEMIRYRNLVVHLDTPIVLVNDKPADVPPTARAMLIYMLFQFGRAISLEEFRSKVHRSSLAKKTLHAHIRRLRAALGVAAELIDTVPGGYGIGLVSKEPVKKLKPLRA